MEKKKRIIIGCILICLFCIIGVYGYVNIAQKNNFKISQVNWNGETKFWTDNTRNNVYDIKFQIFDGTDLKEITSNKSTYAMKIDSTVENGELKIKIYNDKKILFKKNGIINKTINISNDDSKNVKVEITGKSAKGHIKIKLT
ncbi:hypothetical protein [Clostridium kluyveri]|uniref:hypothetical protein n=1 Tax=Clostridium kluyveri TaxID=1534 RepID=UPI00224794EE|nr:hypothetical protein [Clostridium kluyveri]UZQ49942.1 hypothetical protein OP486_18635 [Clostridium kluyveri]